MNRSSNYSTSYKKNKTSGFRKFSQNHKGRKILKMRRKKGRKVL
uniref:50S ribosomal protein L34 n=1 Tax=Calliarthron tuberculosum TaxID=48942 RepID=M4ITN3_CALTB|nr:50S ribosomal protein L34 [Calliarthron tuberculosum]AGA63771.1 50S ribosomal protein L34 [Calliarthron tuberculosum]